ncbi:helix-turn-helix transcriptional regulator [Merdimonas faecis]
MRIDRVKLITEMARQEITQLKLVELSGVSRATISGIQNGRSCSSRSAVKIADALNVPLETLLENH